MEMEMEMEMNGVIKCGPEKGRWVVVRENEVIMRVRERERMN